MLTTDTIRDRQGRRNTDSAAKVVSGAKSRAGGRSVWWTGVLFLFVAVGSGAAQTAQLSVSINVQSSIQLIFKNNANVGQVGYCPLSNPNTNNVGLDLGSAWIFGIHSSTCVAYTAPANTYQVASAFDVLVTKANTSSPNYRLAAQISIAPPANVFWLINNTQLNSAGFTTLDTKDSYNAPVTKELEVQVAWNVAAQVLQETVTFLATAN